MGETRSAADFDPTLALANGEAWNVLGLPRATVEEGGIRMEKVQMSGEGRKSGTWDRQRNIKDRFHMQHLDSISRHGMEQGVKWVRSEQVGRGSRVEGRR